MKEGPLFKLTITKGGQQTTQYKKIIDALPVLCADKGFRYVGEIIRTNTELVEATFIPTYPDETQWLTDHEVYVEVVNKQGMPVSGVLPKKSILTKKTIITNSNLQKKLLSKDDQEFKLKSQEWAKLKADKMAVITIVYGQCDDASQTEITLNPDYKTNCKDGNLIKFLKRVRTVCYGSKDRGFSFKPYKNVVVL